MKKLLIVAGTLVALGIRAGAFEVKGNPDRFMSVGVTTSQEHMSGDHNNLLTPNTPTEALQPQTEKINVDSFGFDVRIPLIDAVTFTLAYDKLRLNSELVRDGNTFQSHQGLNGDRVSVGLRVYLFK